MKGVCILFILISLQSLLFGQSAENRNWILLDNSKTEFRNVFQYTLGYYPELKTVTIKINERSIRTTATCKPIWYTLFRNKSKRIYTITFNNDTTNSGGAILHKVPFEAQIGIIGHELAHIVDYSQMSALGIAKYGISYLFVKQRRKIENRTDCITINHQLGEQLYRFSNYVDTCSIISEKYKLYKQNIYYQPSEIRFLIDTNGCSN